MRKKYETISSLAKEIKQKNRLRDIEDEEIKKLIALELLKKKKIKDGIESMLKEDVSIYLSKRERDEIKKKCREVLHKTYDLFALSTPSKRNELMSRLRTHMNHEGISGPRVIDTCQKILSLHMSSKERLPYYELIYQKIFSFTGKPRVLLDVSAGLNPFSLPFMKQTNFEYIATEYTAYYCSLIDEYFELVEKASQIKGTVCRLNLIDLIAEHQFPLLINRKIDVTFFWKNIPIVEKIRKNSTSKIIQTLPGRFLCISFASKSVLAKQDITLGRIGWFEKMLTNLVTDSYEKFEVGNEVFYVLER